jgi:hypothetical protein
VDVQSIEFALDRYLTAVNDLVLRARDCLVGTIDAADRKRCLDEPLHRLDANGASVARLIDEAADQTKGACKAQLGVARRRLVAARGALTKTTQAVIGESPLVGRRLNDLHRKLNSVRSALVRADRLC